MALEVIGAGFGRTGTHSLKLALEMLGFAPCHHMVEVMRNPEQTQMWRALARGESPGWDALYAGYRSAVDWPTAHYWRELAEVYPKAKMLLTVRDPEAWYRSFQATIGPTMGPGNNPETFGVRVLGQEVFKGRMDDHDFVIGTYEAHNAAVKAAIPPERLLVYQVSEGWEPLCAHLGVPVPAEAFPMTNSTEEFQARAAARAAAQQ